jgi:hypothetical protein
VIVCDWIPPEFGAVGQYEMERARTEASVGRCVTLIGLGKEAGVEKIEFGAGSLTIVRIAATTTDKGSLAKRAQWAVSASRRLLDAMSRSAKLHRSCEIKVTGSPPFLSYQALLWREFNRGHAVTYRITDFYPETAFAAGKAVALRPLSPLIHALRRRADRIEALSECQKKRLAESGVDLGRVTVVRDASPAVFTPNTSPAKRPFGKDDTVLLYSGNLGVAHDWQTFAEAYRRHVQTGPNRVRLWLNATGTGVAPLLSFCERHQLPIHHSPPAPLDALAGILLAADAHLILLGDPFWGYVFPSKVYGCLASGKPCLYVGPQESDVHALLSAHSQHRSVRNGEVESVMHALAELERHTASRSVADPAPFSARH